MRIAFTKPLFPWDCLEDSNEVHQALQQARIKPLIENRALWNVERGARADAARPRRPLEHRLRRGEHGVLL